MDNSSTTILPHPGIPRRRRWLVMVPGLCLAGALAAAPAPVVAQGAGSGPTITVVEIRVEGNHLTGTSRDLIIQSAGLAEGRRYGLAEFSEVSARAVRQLWRLGLFSDVQIFAEQLPGSTTMMLEAVVVIEVVERPKIGSITFRGNKGLNRRKLLDASRLREGMAAGPSTIGQAQERMRDTYRQEGYLRADLTYETRGVGEDSSRVNLVFDITEGSKVGLGSIVVLGNEALSDRQIRRAMETGTGFLFFTRGKYDRAVLEEDRERIRARYAEAGYHDARVISDSLDTGTAGRSVTLVLTVDEGPRYTLGTLTWDGIDRFGAERVHALARIRSGEPLNATRLGQSIDAVQELYLEEGYVYAQLQDQWSYGGEDGTVVNIHVQVFEGEPADVSRIAITGNSRTKDHVIRRELLLKPGDRFSSTLFQRSMREVMALNFFANVELDPPPTPDEEGNLEVTIKVTEKPTGQATMGAGFSERDGLIGNVGLSLPNLMGNGQQLDFTWDFGTLRRTIQVGFTEPWLLNTPTLVGVNVYSSEFFWTTFYKQKREGFGVRVGRRLRWPDDYFRTSIGYRVEDTSFLDFSENYNPSPTYDLRRYDWPIRNSSVSATLFRDSRDRPEFPTFGSLNSLRIEVAGGPFGGDEQYVKWDLTQSFFFPSFWNLVLNTRLKAGLVEGFTTKSRPGLVPFNAKYLPGGTSFDGQIRGYENRRVGPIDRDGLEVGGQSMLIFTLEYVFPVAPQQSIFGLVFADAGNAWRDLGDTDPFDLRRSAGFGLRMFTPMIGLIGFDIAYGLDHFENGRRRGRWVPHFQFGAQFY